MKYSEAREYLIQIKEHLNLESLEQALNLVIANAEKFEKIKEISITKEDFYENLKKIIEEITEQ